MTPARPQSWPPGVQALARPLGPPAPARLAELTTLRVGGPELQQQQPVFLMKAKRRCSLLSWRQ